MNLTSDAGPVRTVNALGLLCPLPIVKTAQALRVMTVGQLVQVLSDDPGILEDLPEWCAETGNELVELVEDGGHWRGLVRKG